MLITKEDKKNMFHGEPKINSFAVFTLCAPRARTHLYTRGEHPETALSRRTNEFGVAARHVCGPVVFEFNATK